MNSQPQAHATPESSQAMPFVVPAIPINPITHAAAHFLEEADGRWDEAEALFSAALRKDPALRNALEDQLITYAVRQLVRLVSRGQRVRLIEQRERKLERGGGQNGVDVHSPNAPSPSTSSGLASHGAATLFDYPLRGGLKLGDAMRQDVQAQAEMHATKAHGEALKATWLAKVAERTPEGLRVRQALTLQELAGLWGE